jgi:hypothetical protein
MSNSMQAITSTLHTDQCVAAVVAVVASHVDTRQTVNYDGEDSMHRHCVSQELHVHQNCTNDSFLVENHQARGILWPGRGSESVQTCREKNLKNRQKWTRVCRVLCSSFLLLALYCATQSKRLKIQSTKRSFVHNSYQFITSSAHSAALASGFRPTGEVVVLVAVKGGQRLEGPTPEKSVSMSVSTLFVKEIQIEHVQKYNASIKTKTAEHMCDMLNHRHHFWVRRNSWKFGSGSSKWKRPSGTTTEQAKLWNRSNEILQMSGFTGGKNAGSSIPVPWRISQWQCATPIK